MKIWEKVLLVITITASVFGIVFTKFWYHKLPVSNAQAYGAAEVIAYLIWIFVLFISSISLFVGVLYIFVPRWRNKKKGFLISAISILSALCYLVSTGYIRFILQQFLK